MSGLNPIASKYINKSTLNSGFPVLACVVVTSEMSVVPALALRHGNATQVSSTVKCDLGKSLVHYNFPLSIVAITECLTPIEEDDKIKRGFVTVKQNTKWYLSAYVLEREIFSTTKAYAHVAAVTKKSNANRSRSTTTAYVSGDVVLRNVYSTAGVTCSFGGDIIKQGAVQVASNPVSKFGASLQSNSNCVHSSTTSTVKSSSLIYVNGGVRLYDDFTCKVFTN